MTGIHCAGTWTTWLRKSQNRMREGLCIIEPLSWNSSGLKKIAFHESGKFKSLERENINTSTV